MVGLGRLYEKKAVTKTCFYVYGERAGLRRADFGSQQPRVWRGVRDIRSTVTGTQLTCRPKGLR